MPITGPRLSGGSLSPTKFGLAEQLLKRSCEGCNVPRLDDAALSAVANELRDRAYRRGYDREPACHRLQNGDGLTLEERWQHEDLSGPEPCADLHSVLGPDQAFLQPESSGLLDKRRVL